jgi:D-arginine dehydrogenase
MAGLPLAKLALPPDAAGMETRDFDVVVIGAGIAGATAAAALAGSRRVALIEAEDAAGYHTTGRSAAMWILNYGPPDVQVLTGASRAFLDAPPTGFNEHPILRRRPVVYLADEEARAELDGLLANGVDVRALTLDQAAAMVPPLRRDSVVGAAIEDDAFEIDVAALHQGFLRQLREAGGVLALRNRAGEIAPQDGIWSVETTAGIRFRAPVVVNAAGAWGDAVARQAGVAPLGLVPCRRTGAIIDPSPFDVRAWPMIIDPLGRWYARPEARTRLMVSPADQTPMHAHDVQPDELDIALGIDRMQQALDIPVRRVERAWAGLRSFVPDGSLAIGWDASAEGFFWCVGQGGYGIQTSPAAGRLVADLVLGRDPGAARDILARVDPTRHAA